MVTADIPINLKALPRTDADAVIEVAQQAVAAGELERGALIHALDSRVVDLERYADAPRAPRGTVRLEEVDSFVAYIKKHHAGDATSLYGSWRAGSITAVLNGHTDAIDPGWGDNRAVLNLVVTPEADRWLARSGQPMSQIAFAEHIEESLPDIVEPAGADMLELAQHFHANTRVAFKSGQRLANGETQLMFEQQIEATAGRNGQLTIPSKFAIAIEPWEGCDRYRIEARLRYRINDGKLLLTYVLDRPDVVQRAAFGDIVKKVTDGTGYDVLVGHAPAALR